MMALVSVSRIVVVIISIWIMIPIPWTPPIIITTVVSPSITMIRSVIVRIT